MCDKAHEDYEDFARNIIDTGMEFDFSAFRYPEEVDVSKDKITELLTRRKNQIELVIDDHLIHLHGQGNLKKFSELTWD